ncbi:hypothetical protein CXF85_03265 [Colwellia sp. 75C3]|uniref:sensor histidine kinase n=1 Tax=Colwellia sp. 75C3 TaxID=888425 RepID=UPI000C32071E|nr:ATP-binding protein [Colwellia sp. 75C3]PKG85812.1 hypothetical protein CXF85_03265 [Colwellia sp. 75C3]
MLKLNIKTRILTFVVLFQIIAYGTIQLFNNLNYKNELTRLKNNEILQTFIATIEKINSLTLLLERNATNLAITSEHLYSLRQEKQLTVEQLSIAIKKILIKNFTSIPEAIGGGIWFEPYLIDPSIKYFGPYAFQGKKEVEFSWQLNTAEYDYHNQDWYTMPSASNWHQEKPSTRALFWTPPYIDDAGSYSLMMTVDAVMFDDQKNMIGMTTVDWSLTKLTSLLSKVKVSENSYPFFIHKASKQFLSYPKDPTLVMQQADQFNWGKQVLSDNKINKLTTLNNILIEGINYNIYFHGTDGGFIFGSLSPVSDLEKDINSIAHLTLLIGTSICFFFIMLLIIFMHVLFSPFDKVLTLIKNSITYRSDDEKIVQIQHISYSEDNEFTPIVHALDEVYEQVRSYIDQITINNAQLIQSKSEINTLNNELEEKVLLRTEQLEAKTQQALDSLTQLKDTQQQLIEQEKHASLGRLVSGVAHEINTPLGISITAASYIKDMTEEFFQQIESGILKKSEFTKKQQKLIESANLLENNLKRTSDLVTSFKQVAVDQSSEEFKQFNLFDYITNVSRSLQPRVEQAKHKLIINCPDTNIEIYSIPGVIIQVITNLVENSLIHAFTDADSGLITIHLLKNEKNIDLIISDNGNGMSPEVIDSIFEPFFTTSRRTGAIGLGMHIVYNLITQQLHGIVSCQSSLGEGTKIIITLPSQKD